MRRLSDARLDFMRATSDGGLVGTTGPIGAQQLVKLARDGKGLWAAPVTDTAQRFVGDVAADRDGGGIVVIGDTPPAGVHLRRYGSAGELAWNRDLPPGVGVASIAVLAGGTIVLAGAAIGPADFTWGSHVRVAAGESRNLLLSAGSDGSPRDLAEEDARQVVALGDGSVLAYGAECRVARYTARLAKLWARQLASLPGAPASAPCRQVVPPFGAAAASPSLVVIVGKEDGPGDFGGGLATEFGQDGFAVGLAT